MENEVDVVTFIKKNNKYSNENGLSVTQKGSLIVDWLAYNFIRWIIGLLNAVEWLSTM